MTGNDLRNISVALAPEFFQAYEWSDIWDRPIENGAAYEWTLISAIYHALKQNSYEIVLPYDAKPELKRLFPLRNEVPFQFASQAGHSLETEEVPLAERFEASLTPKVVFTKDGQFYSLFTEGFPYHKLMSAKVYSERPDIVIVEGSPIDHMPALNADSSRVDFGFNQTHIGVLAGQMRVIKSSVLPLTKRTPPEGCEPSVLAVIETSVNKTYAKAHGQLENYGSIFSSAGSRPHLILVSGNKVEGPDLRSYFTDLSTEDGISLFNLTAEKVLRDIGLI